MLRCERAANSSLSLYAFLCCGVQEIPPGMEQFPIGSGYRVFVKEATELPKSAKLEQRSKRREALGSLSSASSTAST
jgi:hypothetical protein